MADINNGIKFEKVTLFIATQTYCTADSPRYAGCTGLDYLLPVLDAHLDPECKVLDYDSEEYQLIPVPTNKEE